MKLNSENLLTNTNGKRQLPKSSKDIVPCKNKTIVEKGNHINLQTFISIYIQVQCMV